MNLLDRLKGPEPEEPGNEATTATTKLRQGWHDVEARLRRRMRIYPSRWRRQEPGQDPAPTAAGNILAMMADGFHASNPNLQSAVPEATASGSEAGGSDAAGSNAAGTGATADATMRHPLLTGPSVTDAEGEEGSRRRPIISIDGRDLPPEEMEERRLMPRDNKEAA